MEALQCGWSLLRDCYNTNVSLLKLVGPVTTSYKEAYWNSEIDLPLHCRISDPEACRKISPGIS
jgi:hypothetical protein